MGTRSSTDSIRRDLHLRAEELFKKKDTIPAETLLQQTEALQREMEQYAPWEGCSRLRCPLSPYFAYYEITQRIREANVIARTRIPGRFSATRASDIQAGVAKMSAQAERLRGSGSQGEQVAAAFLFGIPGLLATSTDASEVALNTPEAIIERGKEIAAGNICTREQVGIPLLGKVTCPGGVGCGWGCFYKEHKTAIWIVGGVAALGVALTVLSPYAEIAKKMLNLRTRKGR